MGFVPANSPPVEGCQAPLDGVVVWVLYQLTPLLWRGNSPPVEGWQAKLDGVVVWVLYQLTPLLWRGGKRSLTGWLHHVCTG